MSERGETARIPIAGIILLILGVVLLLNTTGVVSWDIWFQFLRFWPMMLIAVGLHIIIAPRFPIISALVVALILVAGIGASYVYELNAEGEFSTNMGSVSHYSWALDDADTLSVEIHFESGSLTIDSDVSSSGDELFSVSAIGIDALVNPALDANAFPHASGWHPTSIDGDVSVIISPDLRSRASRANLLRPYDGGWDIDIDLFGLLQRLSGADWEVAISPDVVLSLDVEAGVADIYLDMSQLDMETLDMDVGAADLELALPADAGHTDVNISAGAADIDIEIPEGVAAYINVAGAATSMDIETGRFPARDGAYVSPGYDTSMNRVELNIDAGASSVSIY